MLVVEADYKQLEMVIAGFKAQDELLLDWVQNGKDSHLETARLAFRDPTIQKNDVRRQACKTVNYSLLYGSGIDNIYTRLKMEFPDISREMVEFAYTETWNLHPGLKKLIADTEKFAQEHKYTETYITKRQRLAFDEIDIKELFNHCIQGTAADLTNRALVGIASEIDWETQRILGQVHDAIILETDNLDKTARLLKKWMEMPVEIDGIERVFKIDVSFGKSWNKKELKEWHDGSNAQKI